jgi:hypothetical protein
LTHKRCSAGTGQNASELNHNVACHLRVLHCLRIDHCHPMNETQTMYKSHGAWHVQSTTFTWASCHALKMVALYIRQWSTYHALGEFGTARIKHGCMTILNVAGHLQFATVCSHEPRSLANWAFCSASYKASPNSAIKQ